MKSKRIKSFLLDDKNFLGLLGMMLALLIVISIIRPAKFYTPNNLVSMLSQFPQYGIMSLGVMIAMIAGGIDLSVVGLANLATISAALILQAMIPEGASSPQAAGAIVLAMAVALLIGLVGGMINGLLVSMLNVPAILATLGTFQAYTGICLVLTGGNIISRLPSQFGDVMGVKVLGAIPLPLVIFVVCVFAMWILLSKSAFGKKVYMIGTNRQAAIYSGLNVKGVIIAAYMVSGVLAAIGGLVMMGRMNSAKADYGSSYTMQCILIVVLGGVDPAGGSGKLKGVVTAILILQVISSGLNMFSQINNFYKQLVWGVVLLSVMVIKYLAANRPPKPAKPVKQQ